MNFIIYFYLFWLIYFFSIRIYLLVSSNLLNNSLALLFKAFYIGLRFDVVICSYVLAPLIIILPLFEKKFIKEVIIKKIIFYYFIFTGFILFYFSITEIFFFKEFGQRYNHLAVEYLIYPREVFTNIFQYYPVISVTIGIIIVYFFISKLFKKFVYSTTFFSFNFLKRTILWIILLCIIFIGMRNSFDHRPINIVLSYFSKNQLLNEVSLNGFFSFCYALIDRLKNVVEYKKNYFSIDDKEARMIVRNKIAENKNIEFINDEEIIRIENKGGEKKYYNVVIIIEESLGAEFTGILGTEENKKYDLTPNIDKIAEKSILFTRAYSTGTRTARAIEGVISSFPPIPGESTIKRSKTVNNFFTIGRVLKAEGYSTHFIYGGQAMFDNMRGFFNSNGFDNIIEEKDFDKYIFKTTWGVSDEDLFNKSLEIFEKQQTQFLAVLLTSSNHMPFTFPEGRIKKLDTNIKDYDRLNAIKYSDYALGEFIKKAEKTKYFNNTIFVILGDHSTRVFGENIIPIKKYHIPLLFYAPEILKNFPKKIDTIISQIDILPSILSILNIPYKSIAFGRNIFSVDKDDGFALLHYDKLIGLLYKEKLCVFYPDKTFKIININNTDNFINLQYEKICAAYFQYADFLYNNSKYKIH
ncbi:MAG TPA: sulfatase-like hydrolase/transferase [bacterium]|nr:sulfatase-like hydrolase/transferase [bacterium]